MLEALEPRVFLHGDAVTGSVIDDGSHDHDTDMTAVVVSDSGADTATDQHTLAAADETLPHSDDPAKQDEHLALLDLVPHAAVTHTAVQSGRWSDATTWADGVLPGADANVLISEGLTVVFDTDNSGQTYQTVRVDGVLQFDHTQDTRMVVDTIVVSPQGTLTIGTEANPIHANVTATVVFADNGDIDTHWDPTLLSRGLLSHGTTNIYGTQVTAHVALDRVPMMGHTELLLSEAPANWRVGDRLVLTGTSPDENQDEELQILAINGNRVTVDPLAYDHTVPESDLKVYVANLTRNVVFTSQNTTDISRRGHVMFMHSPKVQVHHAGFYGLGRTDKKNPLNDPVLDADGHLVDGTGTNRRARYAMHFHRTGIDPNKPPAVVEGIAVDGSPGWGVVNHSSYVNVIDSVTYNVVGAGFVGEAGNEIGSFRGNIAIRSEGSGALPDKRQFILGRENDPTNPKNDDFGHSGHGFWLQGPGIAVEDNVAVGHRHAGFVFWSRALVEFDRNTDEELAQFSSASSFPNFSVLNVIDQPELTEGVEFVRSELVRLRSFKNNVAFASALGLDLSRHMRNLSSRFDGLGWHSVIQGFTAWGIGGFTEGNAAGDNHLNGSERGSQGGKNGVTIRYSRNLVFRELRLIGQNDPESIGANRNNAVDDVTLEGPRIKAFGLAVRNGLIVNNAARVIVTPTSGLITGESGATATFQVVLNTQPTADVTIGVASTDLTEGTVSPSSVAFTPSNWDQPQTVTVIGADDTIADGDTDYFARLFTASSDDADYDGMDPDDVAVTNTDNETPDSAIDFSGVTIESYGNGQDRQGTVSVEDNGLTLHIVGNSWKKMLFPYEVTADTVLEFDFKSSVQGDIHGIGFDIDDEPSIDSRFQIYGTQVSGIQDFADYTPTDGWKHYVIPVGQFFTGEFTYLVFVNDHDRSVPTAESLFSSVVLREGTPPPAPAATGDAHTTASSSAAVLSTATTADHLEDEDATTNAASTTELMATDSDASSAPQADADTTITTDTSTGTNSGDTFDGVISASSITVDLDNSSSTQATTTTTDTGDTLETTKSVLRRLRDLRRLRRI